MFVVLLLVSMYGLSHSWKNQDALYTVSGSFLAFLVAVPVGLVIWTAMRCDNQRSLRFAILPGLLFSAFMILGRNLLVTGYSMIREPVTLLQILCGAIFWVSLLVVILVKLPEWISFVQALDAKRFSLCRKLSDWIHARSEHQRFLLEWALIFLAWVPGLIATYPGMYGYDSVWQVRYYIRNNIELHHPIIHTWYLILCVMILGQQFLGSLELGMLIYSLSQMILLSLCLAYVCRFLRKVGAPRVLRLITLLLFLFLPTNAILSFSSTKDVLYAGTFAVMLCRLLLLYLDHEDSHKKSFLPLTILILFLNLILRSQAVYVNVLAILFALIVFRKRLWKQLLVLLAVSLALLAVWNGPVTKLLQGVEYDSIHEMMSVPCVQLSRAATMYPELLTQEDLNQIAEYVPTYEAYLANNHMGIADDVKNKFRSEHFLEDPMRFVRLWARIGMKCPSAYIDAWGRLTIGLWYPEMTEPDPTAYHPYWEYDNTANWGEDFVIPERTTPHGFHWLSNFYRRLSYESSYQKVPGLFVLFNAAPAVWLLIVLLCEAMFRGNKALRCGLYAPLLLWLTLLLGPVVLYRYVYPIMLTVPVLIGTRFSAPLVEKN